jgi:sterol desaturase/sphingolipid hydroxylase (fatty acid hydroxylase superfamily)
MIYQETINLYLCFLSSFTVASFFAFKDDLDSKTVYIQNDKSRRKDILNIYKKALPLVLFNTFVSIPIILLIFQNFHFILTPLNMYHLLHIPIGGILIDFVFYLFHYLFHTKKFLNLYKYHKVHHQITRPVSITSMYLHPIDLLFGNILPLFLPMLILRTSFLILYFWVFYVIFETTLYAHGGHTHHDGYNHDIHHKYFKYNYGSGMCLSDKLFGTFLDDKSKIAQKIDFFENN